MNGEDIAALVRRIEALEQTVTALRGELDSARHGRLRSMRDTGRCPSCGGGHLLYFRQVQEAADGNTLTDLALGHEKNVWSDAERFARLGAYACCGCRLVEWHAVTLEDVQIDGDLVVELVTDEAPVGGPYR